MNNAFIDDVKRKVLEEEGGRLNEKEALGLFESDDLHAIGELAAEVARRKNGNNAFYIGNLHINPTNICVNRCRFCAFSRTRGEEGAFELSVGEIIGKIKNAYPVSEVHIVGGLHPDWPFKYYLRMLSRIKKAYPTLHIKAFTATEVDYMSRISGLSLEKVLLSLKENGLDTMPGGGAEILDRSVRKKLCPEKLSGERWLEVMEKAHGLGIKTNATMLYGHIEKYEHRVGHLSRLRALQDKTGGFQAFIPLSYHPANTKTGGEGPGGIDDLKTIAVSRLFLDNFPHIKAYWVMLGEKISQVSLFFGADDLDGTIIDEKITRSAGGERSGITEAELIHLIERTGRRPVRRDSFYKKQKKVAKS